MQLLVQLYNSTINATRTITHRTGRVSHAHTVVAVLGVQILQLVPIVTEGSPNGSSGLGYCQQLAWLRAEMAKIFWTMQKFGHQPNGGVKISRQGQYLLIHFSWHVRHMLVTLSDSNRWCWGLDGRKKLAVFGPVVLLEFFSELVYFYMMNFLFGIHMNNGVSVSLMGPLTLSFSAKKGLAHYRFDHFFNS